MATRGAVAAPVEGGSWQGRYVHWGGDLAPALRVILTRDGYAMAVQVLLAENYGWSEVTAESDPELRAGIHDDRFAAVPGYGIAYTTARGQSHPSEWITPDTWEDYGVEVVYVLTGDGVAVIDPASVTVRPGRVTP